MISQKIQDAINKQINAELFSSYLYLSMSACFESMNYKGLAHWMRVQAQEEMAHGMKFFHYVVERGGRVILSAIEGPSTEWESPLAIFEYVYKHEQKVTRLIYDIVELAIAEKDYATKGFLQWFVDEQIEEESSADEVVQKLRLIGDANCGLFMMDNELGSRKFKYSAD